ncbi:MAG: class I SAM-dependent methyltransferase [Candidatus Oxydemutatoraceae bacterium WSBS_2016_MAG_OTU14]
MLSQNNISGSFNFNTHCLVCRSPELKTILDLDSTPLANNLLESNHLPVNKFPLGLAACNQCGHGQLTALVEPEVLFRYYLYLSGTNQTIQLYSDWFAEQVAKLMAKKDYSLLEIAANDGTLLDHFVKRGVKVLGVEPAQNVCKIARGKGLNYINEFWPCSESLNGEQYDVIVGQNVIAHTPNLNSFMAGVRDALSSDGVAIFQTSQALMLQNGEYDTIYHEHFSFFTPQSMAVLCERNGLKLQKTMLSNIHGTSFVFIMTHPNFELELNGAFSDGAFATPCDDIESKFEEINTVYTEFSKKAKASIVDTKKIISDFKQRGYQIAMIGASAKGINVVNATEMAPDFVIDETPLKIDKYIPTIDRPITDFSILKGQQKPTLFFISPWNFKEELMTKITKYKNDAGNDDYCLTCFPSVELIKI